MKGKLTQYLAYLMVFTMVSAGTAVGAGYTDNEDGTVTDNVTGLIWPQTNDDTTRNWEAALSYCEGLVFADVSDWRLPNIRELESIVDIALENPAIDSPFSGTDSSYYWSSTTYVSDPDNEAWAVDFNDGDPDHVDKSGEYHVRCVRGVQ